LFIHPLIHLFIHPAIHPSIHPFIFSSIQQSIHPFIHLFIHPFIHSVSFTQSLSSLTNNHPSLILPYFSNVQTCLTVFPINSVFPHH
jgi:hypothetical protein